MQVELYIGAQSVAPGIGNGKLRGDSSSAMIVAEDKARYAESTNNGNMFSSAVQALVTTTVGLATTYTGLCLSNPLGSGKRLLLNKVSWMQSVLQATQIEGIALAVGFNGTTNVTHTTPVAPKSNLVGSGLTPLGLTDVAATLPTAPTYSHFLANTATATQNNPGGVVDLEGSVILLPGAYIIFATPTQASVAGMWFGFQWEERPLNFGA